MGQYVQEWTKYNMWTTAFKNFEVVSSALEDHTLSNFLKAVFHKFCLFHSWIHCLIHVLFTIVFFFWRRICWWNKWDKWDLINEMFFWPKLLFLKDTSKVICDLVLCVFREGTKISFTGEVPFQCLKTFEAMCFPPLSLFGSQFISNSWAPVCSLQLNFKQIWIHFFWSNLFFSSSG